MKGDVELYAFGNELMMLYGRINLSQGEFANLVGISSIAVHKWESGQNCPKAGSLKRVIEILVHRGAFEQGAEQIEALHLWELAMQRGLKVPFDEVWFVRAMSSIPVGADRTDPSEVGILGKETDTRRDRGFPHPSDPFPDELSALASRALAGLPEDLSLQLPQYLPLRDSAVPDPVSGTDTVRGSDSLSYAAPEPGTDSSPTSPNGLTLAPTRTHRRRKGLLVMLIMLVILLVIGSAGTLFFSARNHATDQTYPGYLSGYGPLAFFDPLNQERGSEWDVVSNDGTGTSCQFTGGAYHASTTHLSRPFFDACYPRGIFSNFALEVQLTVTQGDCGGLLFRADSIEHYYYFLLCEQGWYRVVKSVSSVPDQGQVVLFSAKSSAIHRGLGQQNKMAVVANGNSVFFYVNEQQINHMKDSSYTLGAIGLTACEGYGHVTDVAYRNARLWIL